MALDDLRKRIDELDDRILKLLDERARVVVADVARAKRDANLPDLRPRARATGPRPPRGARRPLPGRGHPRRVPRGDERVPRAPGAGQGRVPRPRGDVLARRGARSFFGLAATYMRGDHLRGRLRRGRSRARRSTASCPIENSSEGSVPHAVDALVAGDLLIRAEFELEVSQCLLGGRAGLASIERVYSQPQALGQCRVWLAKNLGGAQLVQAPSTAAAVREALADPGGAAIASRLASELYGLPVMRERIQDQAENFTRFVVVVARGRGPHRRRQDDARLQRPRRHGPRRADARARDLRRGGHQPHRASSPARAARSPGTTSSSPTSKVIARTRSVARALERACASSARWSSTSAATRARVDGASGA